jgi:hypothetical protein
MATPPMHLHAAHGASIAFLVIAIVFLVICVAWTALNFRRCGWLPVLLLVGGTIASLQESMIDRMILLWYPADAPNVVFTAMGHHQPLYMIIIYAGFVGMGSYVAYSTLVANPGGRGLWAVFLGIIALDAFFEIFATATGVFSYYGSQPFQVVPDGWPLWVAFIAAGSPVLAGTALYVLVPLVHGRARAALVLVPPLAWAAVYFAAGWPTFVTLNSGAPDWLRWVAATATMGTCLGLVRFLTAAGLWASRLPEVASAAPPVPRAHTRQPSAPGASVPATAPFRTTPAGAGGRRDV